MSIDRGDRIILQMVRSICCCGKSGQVADSSDEVVGKTLLKEVFIVCTRNVLSRGLAGKLIGVLEDRHLLPVHMKLMLRPSPELLDKSQLLKNERRRGADDESQGPWMLMVFRGRDAPMRASDAIGAFKTHYALHKEDIYWTTSDQQAKHEESLWFRNDENDVKVAEPETKPEAIVENQELDGAPRESSVISLKEAEASEDVEIPSEVGSAISTEGPHMSVASSQLPSPTPPLQGNLEIENFENSEIKKDEITAETISNTADILEPIPSPIPPIIPSQPTKIE